MGSKLPSIERHAFRQDLEEFLEKAASEPAISEPATSKTAISKSHILEEGSVEKLWLHYSEMVRWNPRLSLIGPGTARTVIDRHYGESLLALPWLEEEDKTLVDVGSGGGFPGLVLAAARANLQVTLVEPRQKKWAFLKTVSRNCGLSCEAVNARVERPFPANLKLPSSIDLVTSRALSLSTDFLEAFLEHSPKTRFLLWCGKELVPLPKSVEIRRQVWFPGSESRRLIEIAASH